jgi:1-acyl-sn-glycerol-3-phosphate acyltransferase
MAAFDKNNQPMDAEALEEHIAAALAINPPTGLELDIPYKFVQRMFKPMVTGAVNIPDRPCLFVGNHSLFALDGLVLGPIMQKELGRFPRGLGDKFLFSLPGIAPLVLKLGGVIGHPEVCSAMMKDGQDLLVFPGGAHEAVKSSSDLYSLQWKERYGFVKLAAMHGYTIMPFGIVGPDEFYGHYIEGSELPASQLGRMLSRFGLLTQDTRTDILPPIPIGTLGSAFPKPQRCYLGFGEAVDLSSYIGQTLSKKSLRIIRNQVADEVEDQLDQLLLLREQNKSHDSLLRRILTL